MDKMQKTNKKEISIKKAAAINAGAKYANIGLNLVFSSILARLLTPNDYGIVAVITVFTTFFSIFSDMGFGTAVIQNKSLSVEEENHIFTFNSWVALVLALFFGIFSYGIAWFYNDSVYIPIGWMLSGVLLFDTLNAIPNALLLKEKRFIRVAVRLVVLTIMSNGAAIIFAMLGFKYYAIVISNLIRAAGSFLWNYFSVNLKFKLRFEWKSIKKVLGFSGYQFAFSFVNYFSRNLDNLLIGKFLGNVSLGYYDKAYKLMQYPVGNLTHVITPVLQPILSDHQDDKNWIYQKYIKIVKLLSIIGVFISAFCFLAGEEIILIMFGDKWTDAILCFRFFSLSVWAQMITASTGSIFQSLGNTKTMFYCGMINSFLTVTAIVLGITTGSIEQVALFVAIIYNMHFVVSFLILMKKAFKLPYLQFLKEIYADILLLVVLIILSVLFPFQIQGLNLLLRVLIKGCYIVILYGAGLAVTKKYKLFSGLFRN